MIISTSWIRTTGQQWKLRVAYILTTIMMIVTAGSFLFWRQFEIPLLVTTAVWLGWIALAIRCPQCGARPGWWYIKNARPSEWFTSFVTSVNCPVCGYEGGRSSAQ